MFAEKFSNREAERNRPRPRIERALEYLPATHLKLIERTRSNQGNTLHRWSFEQVDHCTLVLVVYFSLVFVSSTMAKRHMLVDATTPIPKRLSTTNWKLCVLCQEDTGSALQFPAKTQPRQLWEVDTNHYPITSTSLKT